MREKIIWLDYLRAIGCVLVVLLHTSAFYLYRMEKIDLFSWSVANYIQSFTRISVPLFFMISGYIFFGEKKPHIKNYVRVFSALLFYSALCLIYSKCYKGEPVYEALRNIFFIPVFYHLWFFYALLIVYMICNILTVRDVSFGSAVLFACVFFILINPKLSNLTGLFGFSFKNKLQLDGELIYYVLYAAFGRILGRGLISEALKFVVFAPLFYILSSLLIGYGTFFVSLQAYKYVHVFYTYSSVLVAIGAFSVFVFTRVYANKLQYLDRPLHVLSNNSLAIYGIHALVLDFIFKNGYRDFNHPFIDISCVFFVTLLFSLIFSIFIRKIDRHRLVS
ncbi:acyltransferase [Methylomonas sp. MgM2]